MISFWEMADLFPPILVRLLARKNGMALTDDEIAKASGLNHFRIHVISCMVTWDGIDIPTARAFLTGCQIDFCNGDQMNRMKVYLGVTSRTQFQPAWHHLRRSPDWNTLYEPLKKRYQRWINELTAS